MNDTTNDTKVKFEHSSSSNQRNASNNRRNDYKRRNTDYYSFKPINIS